MTDARLVKVHPVDGTYLIGVPHVEQEVTEAEAKRLTATGAFTTDPPKKAAPAATSDKE